MTQRKGRQKEPRSRSAVGRRDRQSRPRPRTEGGSPWLYGVHAVRAALANPARRCTRLLVTGNLRDSVESPPVEPEIVEREVIEAVLPPGAVHQGIALLAEPLPGSTMEDLVRIAGTRSRTLAVALDQVTDPQNTGAILRSAAAFGASALILPDRHSPEATGALAKAASGALETVPLIRVGNLVRALETLKEGGFWVVGLDVDAPFSLDVADLPARCIFALGAEGRGLRRLTRESCDSLVRIPIGETVESLNVSASAAVAFYEWRRQGASRRP